MKKSIDFRLNGKLTKLEVAGDRMQAGASFVKTSTGFASGGATVEDVKLMRMTAGKDFGVRAAGGIRTLGDALKMIEAGANRLGQAEVLASSSTLNNTRKERNR